MSGFVIYFHGVALVRPLDVPSFQPHTHTITRLRVANNAKHKQRERSECPLDALVRLNVNVCSITYPT